MRCFCRVSEALREESSALTALSLASSSPRVRWVEASSERIWASEEGDDTSAGARDAFPFGVPGRIIILVEAVGLDAVSSAVDAGWSIRVAVRSASLVSSNDQHLHTTENISSALTPQEIARTTALTGVDVLLMRPFSGIACFDCGQVLSKRITHGGRWRSVGSSGGCARSIALMMGCYMK
jgi:hypothetical protein